MRHFKRLFQTLAVSMLILLAVPAATFAASTSTGSGGEACEALGQIAPGGDANCNTNGPTPNRLVRTAVNILTIAAGVIAVIMLIVGGLKYITSQGDAASAASARNTIIYSIVGLVVVVVAQFIVRFVLNRAT